MRRQWAVRRTRTRWSTAPWPCCASTRPSVRVDPVSCLYDARPHTESSSASFSFSSLESDRVHAALAYLSSSFCVASCCALSVISSIYIDVFHPALEHTHRQPSERIDVDRTQSLPLVHTRTHSGRHLARVGASCIMSCTPRWCLSHVPPPITVECGVDELWHGAEAFECPPPCIPSLPPAQARTRSSLRSCSPPSCTQNPSSVAREMHTRTVTRIMRHIMRHPQAYRDAHLQSLTYSRSMYHVRMYLRTHTRVIHRLRMPETKGVTCTVARRVPTTFSVPRSTSAPPTSLRRRCLQARPCVHTRRWR